MIGSTFSQMANAEKLSPQQLQQALKNGVIPSYIGIPLLQEKMKQAQQAQALAAGQQKPMPIAQQIMQQAQAQSGVEGLPSGLPVEGMAGGGIVAFAEGGMYDDSEEDYEDYLDSARQSEMNELMDEYVQAFQGGIGQLPAASKAAPANSEGIASGDAADFVARIMHKESRGRRYDKDGNLLTSEKGAMGEMQVMPGTSRDPGFGVKPARDNSPDELARVGRDYANMLLSRYGDPKLAAIAYNMGPGATDKWLAAGADVSKLPRETQGYVKGFAEGGAIRFQNRGEVKDKYAGVWPYNAPEAGKFKYGSDEEPEVPLTAKEREAQIKADRIAMQRAGVGSLQPLAAAGDVLIGGPVNAASAGVSSLANAIGVPRLGRALGIYDKDVTSVDLPRIGTGTKTPFFDMLRRADANIGTATPESQTKTVSQVPSGGPDLLALDAQRRAAAQRKPAPQEELLSGIDLGGPGSSPANMGDQAAPSVAAAQSQAPADPYQEFKDIFKRREDNLAKQREQDKYMALLSAGLGMMGGTSPNAFQNIGAGAQQGVAALLSANKDRTAEENALLSGRLGLAKIGATAEQQKQMMELRRELAGQTNTRLTQAAEENARLRKEGLDERVRKDLATQLASMEKLATTRMLAKMKNQIIPGQESVVEAQALEALMADPAYRKLYQRVHGIDPISVGGGGSKGDNAGWSIKPVK